MLAGLELGRRVGVARLAADPEGAHKGTGAVDAAIYGLLGLLMAFTFSGAATRFEERRQLIRAEANAIGTAYLRLDLLAPEARGPLQERFRQYLDARLSAYQKLPDIAAARAELDRSMQLQQEIWRGVVAALALPGAPAEVVVLPPINEMFDLATTRLVAMQSRPPFVIYVMLGLTAVLAAVLAGYGMADLRYRRVLHPLVFSVVLATAIYVILDLEFPRLGLIRIDVADQILVDVRNSMR
jgi:uncharacterized membrane protein YagU involved in acid resistance